MALSFDSGDGGILSVDSHRVVPAPFLTKTYQLVDDHVTDDIVSWGEDGSTFVVWRPPEFARDLLPNYFKHNNFSSFVRQLNTYGFRKVVPDRWEFANDFFKKGERHLLCEIHRRKSQSGGMIPGNLLHYGSSSLSPTTSGEEHVAASAWGSSLSSSPLQSPRCISNSMVVGGASAAMSHQQHHPAAVLSLSDENERLRRDNCLLLTELSRLQKQYDDAVLFLQQSMRLSVDDLRRLRSQQQQQQFQVFNGNNSNAKNFATPLIQQQQQHQQQHADFYHQSIWNNNSSSHNNSNAKLVSTISPAKSKLFTASDGGATTPKASTIDFVDGKLRELAHHGGGMIKLQQQQQQQQLDCDQEEDEEGSKLTSGSPAAAAAAETSGAGTRLFGVVLQGRKRVHEEDVSTVSNNSKVAKAELELMPHPAATDAPWLKFRASRDNLCM